jgi:hypothetical protein
VAEIGGADRLEGIVEAGAGAGSDPKTQPPMPTPGFSGLRPTRKLVGVFARSATMTRPKLSMLS